MEKELESIWELRKAVEAKNGEAIRIYSAFHAIGRGSVKHNTLSHDEVLKRFAKCLAGK